MRSQFTNTLNLGRFEYTGAIRPHLSFYNGRRNEELTMEAVQQGLSQTYRDLPRRTASWHRNVEEMAARDPWPGSLLMRARALDATADNVERPKSQLA